MKLATLILFATFPALTANAAEFTLVSKDVAPAPIIVFQDAPPRTRDAAVTLAEYIETISGEKPAIIDGHPSPVPDRAIWIGHQPAVEALFPETDFDFQHPEETLVVVNESHLVIAGRDRWDPAHMTVKKRLSIATGVQQEYGTANAVYAFLRDDLGVRWLWPGEEDVIPQERITIAPMERRYHPKIRARAGLFNKLSLGDNTEGPDEIWYRHQRVQLDSMEMDGGHGFGHWWEKYGRDHPEYFAAAPDGTRTALAINPRNTKLCASNPAVWRQWLVEAEERLLAEPTLRVINVSPNDSYTSGHCTCEGCLAWDHPEGEKFTWVFGGGVKFEGTAQTDRDVRFANTLARMLKERFPDRELYVQLLAYGLARNPPLGVEPDENVIIASVANFPMRSPAEREKPMQQHAGWGEKAKHLMWRPNLGNPAGLTWGMPDVAMTQAGEDFRFAADKHCMGLYFDMFWYHWSTQGPHYYALVHLAWDPQTDVESLMDDYYQRGYGPAAADLRAYWELLERNRMEFVNANPNRMRVFSLPEKYTSDLFAEAQSRLDSAAARLLSADEKYQRRLHFTRCGLEFARLLVDTRAAMQQFEDSKGTDEAARTRVLANWEKVGEMQKEFPPFAINWRSVFQTPGASDGTNKRIEGLHPETPVTARTLKEIQAVGLE